MISLNAQRTQIVAIFAVLGTVIMTSPAAQEPARVTDPVKLSLAAGYKATFTCSSVFNAGRTPEQIAGDELNRIYPGYREALAQLPDAEIDEILRTVSVSYDDNFPARVAIWTGERGCMQLPTGIAIPDDLEGLHDGDYAALFFEAPLNASSTDHASPPELSPAMRRSNINATAKSVAWPMGDGAAQAAGFSTEQHKQVAAAVNKAFDRKTYGEGTESTAVLIVRNGMIIGEQYRDGFDMHTPQRTWSVAKSIAATVIGAAVHDGIVSTDDRVMLTQWPDGDPRLDITLNNMLQMASGLDNGPAGNRTDNIYFGGGRVVDHAATRRLVVTPGTRWYYANNDTMLAMRFLREAMTNDDAYLTYPFSAVLNKLGMHHTYLETDWNGDFIMSSQVYTTARDLGRLGLLYLNNGMWNDERILPENWVDYVTTPAPAQPPNRANGSKRFGYGAQWWLLGGFEGLPADTYAALGNRGQSLTIIPSRDLLIIRRGFDDNGGSQFDVAKFASDMVAALEE